MKKEYYIGIMSGTSLDGVDVVMCAIDSSTCTLEASLFYPMPSPLKQDILRMIEEQTTLSKVAQLEHDLGLLFADGVLALLEKKQIEASMIRAIGLHGQTLWHDPDNALTMQLGDPSILTAQTGIVVVADFRRKDVALGGEGAPFAPAFHHFLFGDTEEKRGVANIGGMANITILGETLLGYDTGCGNVLMDGWSLKHLNTPYDSGGAWAKGGKLNHAFLEAMLGEPYFLEAYPKSTGREKFNQAWLQKHLQNREISPQDVQRTLLELTAQSIANEVKKFEIQSLILCGGGVRNSFLVQRIDSLLPKIKISIAPHSDDIESMCFAWLAYKRIHNQKVNLKEVTGARENSILGGVYA